ncbi:hypothetical protein BJ166DRAFT_597352 [Pestalotiopsis sp. NC0098]|nr:hypothetical protein BJ166DRAFT_597352 [Pestalotiopsis sp. NC0098]
MPDCGWPHRITVAIQVQGEDLFECRAMPDDPTKHREQRDHPNLAEGSKMYCTEDVCYISPPGIGTAFGVRIHRHRDFKHISHHIGYLIIIEGRDMCFVHETGGNTENGLFHKVVEETFIRRSDNEKFEKHAFRFQDAKRHEDRDRKDENGHPLVGTIEVRAYHLHKSVVVPAVTGGEGEGMSLNQYDDPLKGRSVGSVDLDEIDEYSKRAVRADREIVKDTTYRFVNTMSKTWASSGMHWPDFGVLFKDIEKFDDIRTRAAIHDHFASFKFRYRI